MTTALGTDADSDSVAQAKPPFLRRVRIRGYKSIAFCDVLLEPLTILVGRNASGKSNFLDALAFLRDAMETNIPEAVRHHGGWPSVLFRDSRDRQIAFEVEIGFECARPFQQLGEKWTDVTPLANPVDPGLEGMNFVSVYGFVIEAGTHDLPILVREYLNFPEQNGAADFSFEVNRGKFSHDGNSKVDVDGSLALSRQFKVYPFRTDRLLLSVIGNQPLNGMADGLRFSGFYNFQPGVIRQLQKPSPGAMLERDGKNLASLIESVQEIDEATVKRVKSYLNAIVNEVEGFKVLRYGEYETVGFHLRSNKSETTSTLDAASMSDGTLRVLASLMAAFQIHLPSGPTVVGIEEPETVLHPAAMRALVAALDEATLRRQILLTTHSPDLLDTAEIKTANIRVVQMVDGQTVIGPIDEASVSIVADHLSTLGELQRERQLEPDFDDQERQVELQRQERTSR
jgi:predicted ATPase